LSRVPFYTWSSFRIPSVQISSKLGSIFFYHVLPFLHFYMTYLPYFYLPMACLTFLSLFSIFICTFFVGFWAHRLDPSHSSFILSALAILCAEFSIEPRSVLYLVVFSHSFRSNIVKTWKYLFYHVLPFLHFYMTYLPYFYLPMAYLTFLSFFYIFICTFFVG
jgi:hypothetical protein